MLTRKDYQRLVGIMARQSMPDEVREQLSCSLADWLGEDNPRFDRQRFITAANFSPEKREALLAKLEVNT